jgi:hypothetical protein
VAVPSTHAQHLEDTLRALHIVILRDVGSRQEDQHTFAQQDVVELLRRWCFWRIIFGGLNLVWKRSSKGLDVSRPHVVNALQLRLDADSGEGGYPNGGHALWGSSRFQLTWSTSTSSDLQSDRGSDRHISKDETLSRYSKSQKGSRCYVQPSHVDPEDLSNGKVSHKVLSAMLSLSSRGARAYSRDLS